MSQTTLNVPDLVSNPFCLHKIEGWTVQIFGSIGSFKLFLNEMGFTVIPSKPAEFLIIAMLCLRSVIDVEGKEE